MVFVFLQQVGCCFGKNAGLWFGATILHLCDLNPLPDQILTTTFIMINYCAQRFPAVVVAATTGLGSSWADCSKGCPSSWDIHQLRSPWGAGREFFWSLLLVTFRKWSLWIPREDFYLLWENEWRCCFHSRLPSKISLRFSNILNIPLQQKDLNKTRKDDVLMLCVSWCNSAFLTIWAHLLISQYLWSGKVNRKSFRLQAVSVRFVLYLPSGRNERMSKAL